MSKNPRLKPLHPDTSLNAVKLTTLAELSTEVLLESLQPGRHHCLKVRADGTILDGHHRVSILRSRAVNVELLPREVIERAGEQEHEEKR